MKKILVLPNLSIANAMKKLSETAEKGLLVVNKNNKLLGTLTDGDIRRHSNNLYKKKIIKVATKNPTWVSDTDTGLFSINLMNRLGITSVLVTKKKDIKKKIKRLIGILHMHKALALGIK